MWGQYGPYVGTAIAAYGAGKYIHSRYGRRPSQKPRYKRTRYRKVPRKFKKNLLAMKESKFIDITTGNLVPVGATSIVTLLTGVTQGDTDESRDGSDIYITSLQVKLQVLQDIDQVVGANCKLFLVLKKDVRGAALATTNLFVTDNVLSMRQVDNSKNFRILWQKNFALQAPADTATQKNFLIEKYIKFKSPIRAKYLGTGNAVTDIDRNSLSFIFMTDATATPAPIWKFQSRVTFKDV